VSLAVIGAQGLKNNELFTKQDPYVVLQYAGQVLRTKTDIGECLPAGVLLRRGPDGCGRDSTLAHEVHCMRCCSMSQGGQTASHSCCWGLGGHSVSHALTEGVQRHLIGASVHPLTCTSISLPACPCADGRWWHQPRLELHLQPPAPGWTVRVSSGHLWNAPAWRGMTSLGARGEVPLCPTTAGGHAPATACPLTNSWPSQRLLFLLPCMLTMCSHGHGLEHREAAPLLLRSTACPGLPVARNSPFLLVPGTPSSSLIHTAGSTFKACSILGSWTRGTLCLQTATRGESTP